MFSEISENFSRLCQFFSTSTNYEDPAKFEQVINLRKETYLAFADTSQFVSAPLTDDKDFEAFEEGLGIENFMVPLYIPLGSFVYVALPLVVALAMVLILIPFLGPMIFFFVITSIIFLNIPFSAGLGIMTFICNIFNLIGVFTENGLAPAAMLAWMPRE